MRAKDVMSGSVMSVPADTTVLEAAKFLVNRQISAVPVVDAAGVMVGIVSEADLIGNADDFRASHASRARKVTDVMTRDVIAASEDAPLSEIVRLMTGHGVKRIPILRDGAIVGIVSRIDILRGMISLGRDDCAADARPTVARDGDLRRAIYAACQGRSWSLAKQIDVVVQGGAAHLWGTVPTELVRQAYSAAAANVPGVNKVEVHMHVVPPPATRVGL
ncbi:MAG TPA: CBS domain-containing protein [Reyranella sp.]|nr:CBS domain-containing protein [Reyranella sp.]